MVLKIFHHSPSSLENICDFVNIKRKHETCCKDPSYGVASLQLLFLITSNINSHLVRRWVILCTDWLKHRHATSGRLSCRFDLRLVAVCCAA